MFPTDLPLPPPELVCGPRLCQEAAEGSWNQLLHDTRKKGREVRRGTERQIDLHLMALPQDRGFRAEVGDSVRPCTLEAHRCQPAGTDHHGLCLEHLLESACDHSAVVTCLA